MSTTRDKNTSAMGTGGSVSVSNCQTCGNTDLQKVVSLGYTPPVNDMPYVTEEAGGVSVYPLELLFCNVCCLTQLGCIVDPELIFSPDYPYTSGTTSILHKNFEEMVADCVQNVLEPKEDDLIVDIGSNDGTLLSKWQKKGYRVHGIEPTDKAKLSNKNGVPATQAFFDMDSARAAREKLGPAKVITATNVFAHIENVHSIIEAVKILLDEDGVFITESHYLLDLIQTCQYDTIYHEHLRYYSLRSLRYLFETHDLEVVYTKRIPTHGGSIRVYTSRKGKFQVSNSVQKIAKLEQKSAINEVENFSHFRQAVISSKLKLYNLLSDIHSKGKKIYAIGAPSRASTLVSYTGLDNNIIDCVLELPGSHKIGRFMPGTQIPIKDEAILYEDQPDFALLLSWHIADELVEKIRARGFKNSFIIPLGTPRIIE